MEKVWAVYRKEVPPHLRYLIEDWQVMLRNGSWIHNGMPEAVESIVEWKVVWLWLQNNLHSNILKQIQNVRFADLTQLFLKNNSIESVEGIKALRMPSINMILLGKKLVDQDMNHISTIRQFAHLRCHALNGIGLTDNPISDINSLTGLFLGTQNQFLELEVFRASEMWCCLGWILKSPMNLHRLYIRGESRISQGRVKEVLRRRTYYMQICEEDY